MRHSYIKDGNKIYEPKEVEIVREAELENVIDNTPHDTKEYNVKMNTIQHKYGKDDESKEVIGELD
ncbi:hypothetical protein RBU49_09560 [Clostridium sp. MB40-C1]|uniref:hypothetical protein n=1 Tax=Clostridium sp. MB40-C1 TaxID=3070996 RepID=UPI0027E1FEDB|nr:hypothetical protein [Clostridium sp. MB40-C1]WMJ79138.1 hypothetical protein RBU49_09560 [Clostridium sp. MB40-C1]